MKASMLVLGLAAVAVADDCKTYRKLADGICADACLPGRTGLCPRDLIVTTGGLQGGACKDLKYTIDIGPITKQAGPCGKLTFEQYNISTPANSTPAMLLEARYGASEGDVTVLASFSDPATTFKWQAQNDPVMGGASKSSFTIDEANHVGVFNGTCAIIPFLNAPGFAKISSLTTALPDVSSFIDGGIELRIKSQIPYAGWRLGFGAKDVPRTSQFGGGSFKGNFDLEDTTEFQTARVPFSSFSYDWSGFTGRCDTKDPDSPQGVPGVKHVCCSAEHPEVCPTKAFLSSMTDVQLWAEGVEGDFRVEVDYFAVYA